MRKRKKIKQTEQQIILRDVEDTRRLSPNTFSGYQLCQSSKHQLFSPDDGDRIGLRNPELPFLIYAAGNPRSFISIYWNIYSTAGTALYWSCCFCSIIKQPATLSVSDYTSRCKSNKYWFHSRQSHDISLSQSSDLALWPTQPPVQCVGEALYQV
jgi:hypothetical protein